MCFNGRSRSPVPQKKPKRKPANRTIMSCYVPGCPTRNVKKLADHLRNIHKDLSEEERHHYLKVGRQHAKRVSTKILHNFASDHFINRMDPFKKQFVGYVVFKKY